MPRSNLIAFPQTTQSFASGSSNTAEALQKAAPPDSQIRTTAGKAMRMPGDRSAAHGLMKKLTGFLKKNKPAKSNFASLSTIDVASTANKSGFLNNWAAKSNFASLSTLDIASTANKSRFLRNNWAVKSNFASPSTLDIASTANKSGFVECCMTHPQHGTVSITPNRIDANTIKFTIDLKTNAGKLISDFHHMYISDSDSDHRGHSTLGYSIIDFDPDLQGKGIGFVYHHTAAHVAQSLNRELFVVDNVSSDAMGGLCERSKMRFDSHNNCELEPATLIKNIGEILKEKGWKDSNPFR